MTTIRCACPWCGDIEITKSDIQLRLCAADNSGSYAFRCPTCQMMVAKSAAAKIVDLLVNCGIHPIVWQLPAELKEHDGFNDPLDSNTVNKWIIDLNEGDGFAKEWAKLFS